MTNPVQTPKSLVKAKLVQVKIDAVMAATNLLLASRGYEAMTMDEVALQAGLSKASLYNLFDSKESLAGEAMIQVLRIGLEEVNRLRDMADLPAVQKLRRITAWAMRTKIEGKMPSLPAQNSNLSEALKANEDYMARLFELSMKLGIWVGEAQQNGDIAASFPSEFVLYNLYARACDPVLEALKSEGNYSNDEIVNLILELHFAGMRTARL
ncbi:MAG: helix-turn-helix domain-containing protein [Cytophagales bacterium]|nr:helix-turn-helix domain-containing protein [Cytophagales bacterium]